MGSNILHRLSDATLAALYAPGAAWPRSLLSTPAIPDGWMGLVIRPDGRRRVAPSGEPPRCEDTDALLLVRTGPIVVRIQVARAPTGDGNSIDAECALHLRWAARDADLAALRESLLAAESSGELTLDRLAQRIADAGGRAALLRHVQQHTAARLVYEDTRGEFLERIRAQLARFLFESGASVEQAATLRCTSPTLAAHETLQREAAQKLEQIKARRQVEQAAMSATQKRIGELTGVLEKLRSVASTQENLRWHDLLPSLAPAERGRLLENLWRISPDQRITTAIALAAGDECIWLDPLWPEKILRRVALPADLGALRSIAFCPQRGWLLVGAATGVWAVSADDGGVEMRFAVPGDVTARTGFNSALLVGDRLFATHSQLGAWTWTMPVAAQSATAADARCVFAPADGVPRTIRSAVALADGRVLFAADDCVYACRSANGECTVLAAVDDAIHALAVDEDDLYIATADGKILMLAVSQPDDCWMVHRAGGPVESLLVRRWNDLVELVVPALGQGVLSIFGEQNVISRLLESTSPIRKAWASDDIVVGLSDRRDRVIVMNSESADRTGREAALARTLGCSIQDICLVTRPATG
ncbi:MAG: hypothetical protein HZB38_01615 [Planctomycetes bacterium]|nr:hypothetical protein [Planctomycetota bacterium]